jgi:hypothetical protein
MAKKIAPSVYRYRGHELRRMGEGWTISGPCLNGEAGTIRRAMRRIDQAPGVPAKVDPSAAGRLGALAFHTRYRLQPLGTSDFAVVRRKDGQVVNTLKGFSPFERN